MNYNSYTFWTQVKVIHNGKPPFFGGLFVFGYGAPAFTKVSAGKQPVFSYNVTNLDETSVTTPDPSR